MINTRYTVQCSAVQCSAVQCRWLPSPEPEAVSMPGRRPCQGCRRERLYMGQISQDGGDSKFRSLFPTFQALQFGLGDNAEIASTISRNVAAV
jgi:hypothetical protein